MARSTQDGRTRRSDATRQLLLGAASRMLGSHGYKGATMEALGRMARVNKALIAYHFGSKKGLFREAAAQPFDELLDSLGTLDPGAPAREQLRHFIAAFAHACSRHPALASLVLQEPVAGGAYIGPAIRAKMSAVYEVLARIIIAAERKGEFRPVHPLSVHMAIVGSLAFYYGTRGVVGLAAREGALKATLPDERRFRAELEALILQGVSKA